MARQRLHRPLRIDDHPIGQSLYRFDAAAVLFRVALFDMLGVLDRDHVMDQADEPRPRAAFDALERLRAIESVMRHQEVDKRLADALGARPDCLFAPHDDMRAQPSDDRDYLFADDRIDRLARPQRLEPVDQRDRQMIGHQPEPVPPPDEAQTIARGRDQVPCIRQFDPVDTSRREPLRAPQEAR